MQGHQLLVWFTSCDPGLRPTSSLAERAKHRTDAEWGEDGTIKTRDPYRRNLNRDRSMDNEEEQRAREPFVWSPNIFKTNLEDNSRRHVSRRHQVAVYRPPAEPSNPPSSISKMTFESSEQLIQGSDSTTHLRSAQMDLETDEMQAEFRMNKAVHTRRNGTSSFLQVGARTSTSNSTSQFNFSKASSTYTYTGSQFPEQVRPVLGLPPLTYTPVNGLSLNGPAIANGTATSAQSVTNSIITGQVITQHITTTTTSTQRTTTVQRTRQGTPRVVDQMDFRPPVLQSNANPPVRRTLRNPNGHVGRMSQRVLTQIPTVRRVLRHDDMPVLEPQQNFAPRMTNGVHRLPAPIVRNPPSNDEANGPRTRRASYNTRQSLPK
ncbi:hypothetical protein L596_011023 [Steinernema carpocapsae]|uniref:Uncharacterized protein n=1 Tax=Steinernema carpocapsae TaxID=34508 RepID=A0A4U5NTD9_STECR|nr:hypothetical protein L596_011023 [Steinernema carpocapsae]